jgi:hypothetical protein
VRGGSTVDRGQHSRKIPGIALEDRSKRLDHERNEVRTLGVGGSSGANAGLRPGCSRQVRFGQRTQMGAHAQPE